MSWVVQAAAVAAALISTTAAVESALVDVGEITPVHVSTPLFDTRLTDDNGCDPVGCTGKLTRDGDRTTAISRWSCKPELGPAGSICVITYSLDAPLALEQLRVALYEGDTRQRTLEVYVGGRLVTTWTSSGSTTDFEAIDLPGRSTQTLELRGVLSSSEWLSISEVELLVEDGSVVEARTLGTVVTTASFYDTRLASGGGCDPSGCEASLTRDNDLDENSRWSCAPSLGGECSITYDLGAAYGLYEIQLFLYKGSERTRTVEIFVDGEISTTWTSSGTVDGFEIIDMSDFSGQVIEIRGYLPDSNTWLSIIETRIMVFPDQLEPPSPTPDSPSPTPVAPTPTPVPPSPTPDTELPVTRTTSDTRLIVEAGELEWVNIDLLRHLYDTRIAVEGGCDPTGCIADYTRDGLLDEDKRWSCQFILPSTSDFDLSYYQCRLSYYLEEPQEIYGVRVALHKGDERTRELELWVEGVAWVTGWTSSGTTTGFEEILMPTSGVVGQLVEILAVLDEDEWISITEVAIDVVVDDVPLLGVSAAERVDVTATSDAGDPSVLLDGSYGSGEESWECTGDTCSVTFDLQTIQTIVQLSLTFVEGNNIFADIVDVWVAYSETRGYTKVLSDVPSNKERTLTPQQFSLVERARFVRITPSALGSGLVNMAEVDIRLSEDAPIHPVSTDSSLMSAGRIPKAEGDEGDSRTEEEGGCGTRGCTLINVKDGDMSTFWRCYGNPNEVECSGYYRLAYPRRLKQIRIALADGAERVSEMIFEGASSTERLSVLSSGETDGFETYDFDVTTTWVRISARFRSVMEAISISEVEFLVEELPEGEIQTTEPSTWSTYFDDTTTDSEVVPQLFRRYTLIFYATVSAIELELPTGQQHEFDVLVFDAKDEYEDGLLQGFVSEDVEGFQTFTLDGIPDDLVVSSLLILIPGTNEDGDGFDLLGSRVIGEYVPNPTGEFLVASVAIEEWRGTRYPDFVGDGIADQEAIMGAICAVKEAEFDGLKCVGVNPDATGEVDFVLGEYYVNGNIFMESGVTLDGRFSIDDYPYTTDIILTEGAAGNTDVPAIFVFDGVKDTRFDSLFVYGNYNAETDSGISATPGLGSKGFEFTNCKNVTARYIQSRNMDGDGITVTDSELISIDAGPFDDEYLPWRIIDNRGTGLLIENSESVWIRRHTFFDNGVAGLVIRDSKNVTFEATYDSFASTGEGNVGSLDGLQPLDVSVEGSTMVKFDHMRVRSSNEPAITVSADSSDVSFFECGFDSIASGACVIEAADPSVVNVTDSGGELVLEGLCFEKV